MMLNTLIMSVSGLILIILGLLLVFVGRKLVKVLTFLTGGLAGALLAYHYSLPAVGVPLAYVIGVIGFIIVGLIAYALLYVAAGIVAGVLVYLFARPFFGGILIPIVLAIVAFAVVIILFNKILSIGTAILGAIVVSYGINQLTPLHPYISLAIAVLLAILGSYVQLKQR